MTPADRAMDRLGRPLGVLRLSLTARCNLACTYCCPADDEPDDRLDLVEQLAIIRSACRLGVRSLRLTGGEPLLSDRLEPLLRTIAAARSDGQDPLAALEEIALTTNGVLLTSERAATLRRCGLDRITISLDAVTGDRFGAMAGVAQSGDKLLQRVMAGLESARSAGFDPSRGALKINSVIQRHANDDQLIPLAALARRLGVGLRLIEYMDVGNRNQWHADQVMPAAEMVDRLHKRWPLEPMGRSSGSTATQWRYRDGQGFLGVIASISEPFCGDCNRLRITADGMAYTCLFAEQGTSLMPWLRPSLDPDRLTDGMVSLWRQRFDRYSEERGRATRGSGRRPEMVVLGG